MNFESKILYAFCYLLSHGNQLWRIELGYNTLQNLHAMLIIPKKH